MYVLIRGGHVARYPYSATDLILSRPDISWPKGMLRDELLAEHGVFPVRLIPPPAIGDTERAVEDLPEHVGDTWVQTWTVEEKSPDEMAAEVAAWRASMSVSPLQIRRALLRQGLLDDVTAYVEQADLETRMAWEYAVQIDRDSALITVAAEAIGATPADVDDLFRLAATL